MQAAAGGGAARRRIACPQAAEQQNGAVQRAPMKNVLKRGSARYSGTAVQNRLSLYTRTRTVNIRYARRRNSSCTGREEKA